jgi:uncharacterized membrane protein
MPMRRWLEARVMVVILSDWIFQIHGLCIITFEGLFCLYLFTIAGFFACIFTIAARFAYIDSSRVAFIITTEDSFYVY